MAIGPTRGPLTKRVKGKALAQVLSVYPERLMALVPRLALFQGIDEKDIPSIIQHFEWMSLPGGWTLMRDGEEARHLHIITAGSIGTMITDAKGVEHMANQLTPGQTVGEFGVLTGEKRIGTLIALRDTELLRISGETFLELAAAFPEIMENLARILGYRVYDLMRGKRNIDEWRSVPKTIAILPLGERAPCHQIAQQLKIALAERGKRVRLLDGECQSKNSEWFYDVEAQHDHVLYVAEDLTSPWTQLSLRQADRILFVARADSEAPTGHSIDPFVRKGARRFVELALVHPAGADVARGAIDWVGAINPDYHYNVRENNRGDMARMARFLSGRAVGLVLAGGGARGFAHLGVLRALDEAGIHIDHIGGTSMGGIVGAGVALGWSHDELKERMRKSFVMQNPLGKLTFPSISIFGGKRVQHLLQDNFADMHIEELWLPYFCVSSNLTIGREIIQRRGLLWQALRASVAIPGIVPPVVDHGDVLVDGAVINNFPADIMAEMRRGPIIGIDVESHKAFSDLTEGWVDNPDWGVLGENIRGGPNIISILMRAGTVNSEAQTNASRVHTDLLFEPPVDEIAIRDWREFETAIDAGYVHANEVLAKADLSLFGL